MKNQKTTTQLVQLVAEQLDTIHMYPWTAKRHHRKSDAKDYQMIPGGPSNQQYEAVKTKVINMCNQIGVLFVLFGLIASIHVDVKQTFN